jgi:hypothetical protein
VNERVAVPAERRGDAAVVGGSRYGTPERGAGRWARVRSRGGWLLDRGLADAPVSWRELVAVAALLSVLTLALFSWHALHAGFYSDDWAYRVAWWEWDRHGGFSNAFHLYWHSTLLAGRPLLTLYLVAVQVLFGDHQHWYLAWAMVLAVLLSACFYLFLRTLHLPCLHAAALAILLLVFPASDSTRIWAIISDAQVSMSACLLGGVLALRSFERSGRRMLALRAGSLALYAVSILHYELTMLAIVASAIVYRCRVPWRRALKAGALDVGLVVVLYALVKRTVETEHLGASAAISHGRDIARQVVQLFTSVVMPLDSTKLAALAPVMLVLGAAIIVQRSLPRDDWAAKALGRWLFAAAVAAAMVVAAYAIYAPAALFYMPLAPGLLNRTNAFGALPLVFLGYAIGALGGIVAFRGLQHGPRLAGFFALVVALVLGLSYTHRLTRDLTLWDSADARALRTLDVVRGNVPQPPPGSVVVAFGQPVEEAPGIPVWAHNWDFDGAIRLMWRDSTLRGLPAFPGTMIACGRTSARPQNASYPRVYQETDARSYGRLVFVDTSTGHFAVPRNQSDCRKQAMSFQPGPFYTPRDELP